MDTESGMDAVGMGLPKKKLLKIMKKHDGKSRFKGANDE
jgi:hypothetical protein